MRLQHIHWKQTQLLAEDYIHDYDKVQELFEYNPWAPKSVEERAAWLDQQKTISAPREEVIQALEQYNRRFSNSAQVIEMIHRLKQSHALVIVGGQQAGLFTGPLLVIHKAISILRAAKEAEQRLKRPVIPVFWIAGEDHDLDEVNHIHQLTPQLALEKIELNSSKGQVKRAPISRLSITAEQWEQVLEKLDATLMSTDFKSNWMGKIREISKQSDTLVDFFAAMMSMLFGSEGLVMMDSDDPNLRRLEAPMFRELIKQQQSIGQALTVSKDRLMGLGYEPQADIREGNANLFVVHEGERLLLQRQDDHYSDKTGHIRLSEAELLSLAEQEPENFSNNVFTRPLMQNYLFPVLSAVLGGGEIAYWALTREAFRSVGDQMPIILPRLEFTLVEGTVQKQFGKLDLSFEDAVLHLEEKRDEWLENQDSMGLPQMFANVKEQFGALYGPVLDAIGTINPGLRQLGDTNHQKIIEQIQFLEAKSKDAHEAQFDAAKRQYERIRLSLTPLGKRQERVYNVISYLNKYGDEWLKELLRAEFEWNGSHIAVYL
ncbi:MAG: bacillithiol biosynthesis cysteine-adding enzyme BshC [Paenibacillaceae bacterium]